MCKFFIFFVCIFLFGTAKTENLIDFNQNEYKVIADIISHLSYEKNQDNISIQNRTLYEQIIWKAFVWRFYQANSRDSLLYFNQLKGIDLNEIPDLVAKKLLLRAYQVEKASELVLNEVLFLYPTKYNSEELSLILEIFLNAKGQELHSTTFYILLMNNIITIGSPVNILDKLSDGELEKVKRKAIKVQGNV